MRLKHFTVRVIAAEFDTDAVKAERTVFRAPPGKVYVESTREQIVERVVNYLDKKYPTLDFRMVDVGPTQINFVPTGRREVAALKEAFREGRNREQGEQGRHDSVGDSRGTASGDSGSRAGE